MSGNATLISREVVRRVGNIDPAFVQLMGDFDYGLRARAAGCSVWIAPGTVGTCASNPKRRPRERPLGEELRRLVVDQGAGAGSVGGLQPPMGRPALAGVLAEPLCAPRGHPGPGAHTAAAFAACCAMSEFDVSDEPDKGAMTVTRSVK